MSPTRRRVVVAVGALAAAAAAVAFQLGGQSVGAPRDAEPESFVVAGDGDLPAVRPNLRAARAPLSTEEVGYAAHLALTESSLPEGASDVRGDDGAQVIFTDIPRLAEADGSARLAIVMLYDYTSGAAFQSLVDLTAGEVRSTESNPGAQPPIVADEADVALEIALASPANLPFRTKFEEDTGVPLLGREQVAYKAGTWLYDGTTRAGKACGKHRCARLLIQTPSGVFLPTSDFVVDLTTRAVVVLEGPRA